MAHNMRFRSGVRSLRRLRVAAATVIEVGDLIYVDQGLAKPANSFAWTTDAATTRAGFAAKFVGVAYQASSVGETDDVSVDVSLDAVYEFAMKSDPYELGVLVAPDIVGNQLQNQQLAAVTNANQSIGMTAEYATAPVTRLRVVLDSRLVAPRLRA